MSNDGGFIALLEAWFAAQLAALAYGGKLVFTKVDVWRHQVAATKAGVEAFDRVAPFAFPSWAGTDVKREGGYDLCQVPGISILIGTTSVADGDARTGTSAKLGISKIHDLVIALFDKKHPGGGLTCDEIYYIGTIELLDAPKAHLIEMRFEISYIATS